MKKHTPPHLARWLWNKYCKDEEKSTLVHDLDEYFSEISIDKKRMNACFWYWKQVIGSMLSLTKQQIFFGGNMLKNYLKIGLRNIRRNKGYSFINIAGLAVGMATLILIALHVQYELSFDSFHKKKDRIYRVVLQDTGHFYEGSDYLAVTPAPLAPAMMDILPEVTLATRVKDISEALIQYDDKSFYAEGLYADEFFLEIFTFPLALSDKKSSLREPFSIIVSKSLAGKIFGDKNPLGETLRLFEQYDYKITGILEDIPENSHLKFDFLVSIYHNHLSAWRSNISYYTYFELHKDATAGNLENKISAFAGKMDAPQPGQKIKTKTNLVIQPLDEIHFTTDVNFEISNNTDKKYIYLFSSIGLLILVIACINYMNLSTARFSKRGREIGIRKVVGAQRRQLFGQYISESLTISFIAVLLALILVHLVHPWLRGFSGRPVEINYAENPMLLLFLAGIVFFTGLLGGSYPAFVLSSFQPVKILHGFPGNLKRSSRQRSILVIMQFCASIVLIIGMVIIYKQLIFLKNKDTGYKREHIIAVSVSERGIESNYKTIKNLLLENPDIINVASSSDLPFNIANRCPATFKDANYEEKTMLFYEISVDYDFFDLYGIEFIEGRKFSVEFSSDERNTIILNETAARTIGWDKPIGKQFSMWYVKNGTVIGIAKDFNFHTLRNPIEPLHFYLRPDYANYISVKVNPGNLTRTIPFIESTIKKFGGKYPFEYTFIDEGFNRMYLSEKNLGLMVGCFSGLAIFIASLGLIGLASYTAERRFKEIGIRKVLGSSVPGILVLLCQGLIKRIMLANLVAWPIAYYFMNKWLQIFTYRINLNVWPFILSGLAAFCIALLTIGYQSYKAATANPVDSLRYE